MSEHVSGQDWLSPYRPDATPEELRENILEILDVAQDFCGRYSLMLGDVVALVRDGKKFETEAALGNLSSALDLMSNDLQEQQRCLRITAEKLGKCWEMFSSLYRKITGGKEPEFNS